MTANQILAEIREANLSYLMLAQSLIRTDREQALFRLGVNEETIKKRVQRARQMLADCVAGAAGASS